MASQNLFTPFVAGTVNISATNSSQRVALGISSDQNAPRQVRIKNADATAVAFVEFGTATVTASTTASMPVGPGETVGITLAPGQIFAAAITGTTATVYFTPGYGT